MRFTHLCETCFVSETSGDCRMECAFIAVELSARISLWSLFPRLPPPLHTVVTSAFALSCCAIPQLSDSATKHRVRIFFWGARATLLSINSPYFHTQKNEKRNSLLKPSGTREKKELEEILCHFQNFHTLLSYKRTITRFSSVSESFDLSRACPTKVFLFF
jgi:hypothetical protein